MREWGTDFPFGERMEGRKKEEMKCLLRKLKTANIEGGILKSLEFSVI